MSRRRIRHASPVRSLLLMLLALCVALAPMISAACDVHEAGHVAMDASPHAHDGPADDSAGDDGQDRDLWHALMHASHCCGHTALPSAPIVTGTPVVAAVRLPDPDRPQPASPVSELFRPPIRG